MNVGGASSALVYLPMQVSYDPAGLPVFRYDGQQAASQQALWNETHAADAEEDGWQELPQENCGSFCCRSFP